MFGSRIERRIVHEGRFFRCKTKRDSIDQIGTRVFRGIIQRRNRRTHDVQKWWLRPDLKLLTALKFFAVASDRRARRVEVSGRERTSWYAIGPNRNPTPLSGRAAGEKWWLRPDLNRGPHHYEYGSTILTIYLSTTYRGTRCKFISTEHNWCPQNSHIGKFTSTYSVQLIKTVTIISYRRYA